MFKKQKISLRNRKIGSLFFEIPGVINYNSQDYVEVQPGVMTPLVINIKSTLSYFNIRAKFAKELVKQANDDTEKKFSQRISDSEDRRDFERDFQDYIDKNSDVVQYLPEINKWFDENPDQYRIDIAHAAVKVKVLSAQQAKSDEEDAAEAAKNVASNAAGGGSQNATMIDDKETIDKLIMGKSNPNSL